MMPILRRKAVLRMADIYKEQEREPAFDAVIPAPVRHSQDLCANAKLVYGEIRSLADNYGYCWASNRFFAELYKLTERSVARIIKQLAELNFVNIKILRDKQGHVSGRRIYIGCGFPEQENDTLSHMTKKSDHMTKMSGLTDKNVSQDINKNIITKKGDACAPAREKPLVDGAAREVLKAWARSQFPEQSECLIADLMDFCDVRCAARKPMIKPTIAERCIKRLLEFSEGNIEVIRAILDRSIRKPWTDVYKLPEDELAEVLRQNGSLREEDGGEKWV